MRLIHWVLSLTLVSSLVLAGCGLGVDVPLVSSPISAAQKAAVEQEVRQFAALVSRDVTQEGPAAWQKHFADDPAFFMAAEGKLQFPNRQAAREGIEGLTRILPHIELNWGDDLRIDPLTAEFAQVATSWHEVLVDKDGHRMEEAGFFTGLVEKRGRQWQFRNAHWSVVAPAPASKAP